MHGLVVDRWKLADLRKIVDDPQVLTIYVADVAFDLRIGEEFSGQGVDGAGQTR